MKRIAVILALAFLCAVPAAADSVTPTITELGLGYSTNSATVNWTIQVPELFNPFGVRHDFDGSGTSATPVITCAAPCTYGSTFTFDLLVSGLSIKSVLYNSVFYPTVYLSGVLSLDAKSFVLVQGNLNVAVPVQMTGTFVGCADPACKIQLFPMNINIPGTAFISLFVDQSGQIDVDSAYFYAPEPPSAVLLGSGCLMIGGIVCLARRRHLRYNAAAFA